MSSKVTPIWFVIAIIAAMLISGIVYSNTIVFNQRCEGHLKRAADANTIEMAISELDIAIKYLEEKGDTIGYTSVFFETPDEDIAFWYHNLVACRNELMALPEDASSLERTNMLMKLRETLTDDTEHGVKVTAPRGMARYPSNGAYGTLLFGSWGAVLLLYLILI